MQPLFVFLQYFLPNRIWEVEEEATPDITALDKPESIFTAVPSPNKVLPWQGEALGEGCNEQSNASKAEDPPELQVSLLLSVHPAGIRMQYFNPSIGNQERVRCLLHQTMPWCLLEGRHGPFCAPV